ncbi:hypothetical protein [Akkermansia sp.]|uniref:hypothetical protein n=1 Tax=Akkermansia sp. TaxID=1872421 RepID=UPI0025B98EE2|nr:hypothetical protein [Akkermansia sp.]MCC8149081.1 hypothetical protein [Akkermansia sp.]
MITIYIPAYSGNGPEAVECVACAAQTFPEARIIVANDGNNPMPDQCRDACSCDVVTTDFERGRNLNGPEAVRGILSLLSCGVQDDDIILKVDPDTALIGRSWLQPMLDNPEIPFSACGTDYQAAYGCCYALRGHIARELSVIMQDAPLSAICPEDITIGRYILDHYDGSKIYYPWSPERWDGLFSAWRWQCGGKATTGTYARRFDVVTTGNPVCSPFPSLTRATVMFNLRRAAADLPPTLRRY